MLRGGGPHPSLCRRLERAEFAFNKLQSVWQAEQATHGATASLARAFVKTWRSWYIVPVIWSCLWITFGCISGAYLMRTLVMWFELQDHSRSYMAGIALALVCSEVCKVCADGGGCGVHGRCPCAAVVPP